MSNMKRILERLNELEENLYNYGIHSEVVIQEVKLLCELGFVDEVNGILYEFEQFIYNS